MGTIWVCCLFSLCPRSPPPKLSSRSLALQDAVVTNKDLDLPTQQELLAQFRCDEIANVAFAAFVEALKAFGSSAGVGKLVKGLGVSMEQARSAALGEWKCTLMLRH